MEAHVITSEEMFFHWSLANIPFNHEVVGFLEAKGDPSDFIVEGKSYVAIRRHRVDSRNIYVSHYFSTIVFGNYSQRIIQRKEKDILRATAVRLYYTDSILYEGTKRIYDPLGALASFIAPPLRYR